MLDLQALTLAGFSVWAVVSAPTVAILIGWVIALRHQNGITNQRLAFLEYEYERQTGVHPFVVQAKASAARFSLPP